MEGKRFYFISLRFNINVMVVVIAKLQEVAAISANCVTDIFIRAVVLKWRKTKQQKLTCITAPTVRLHTGHLSVSKHCFLVMTS